jgi:hypothetical protein
VGFEILREEMSSLFLIYLVEHDVGVCTCEKVKEKWSFEFGFFCWVCARVVD